MTTRSRNKTVALSAEEKRAKINVEAARSAMKVLWSSDHAFLKPEAAKNIGEAFGMEIKPQVMIANKQNKHGQYTDPKGLFVDDVGPNTKVEGYDARDLADDICRYHDLAVPFMYGRGSGLRAACTVLDQYLDALEMKPVEA